MSKKKKDGAALGCRTARLASQGRHPGERQVIAIWWSWSSGFRLRVCQREFLPRCVPVVANQWLSSARPDWGQTNEQATAARLFVEEKYQKGNLYGTPAGKNLLEHLQKMRDSLDDLSAHDVRFVRVSFFGIGFDINDLGMFAGIGFSVLLLMLAFSLKREARNLKFYFALLEKESVGQTGYNLLAMRQVLIMPTVAEDGEAGWAWSFLQWLPISIPILVELAIVVEDFCSFSVGLAWSHARTYALIGVNSVAFVVVVLLTALCFNYRKNISAQWSAAYRKYLGKTSE